MTPAAKAAAICAVLSAGRFDLSDEIRCHDEMEAWLRERLTADLIEREVRLGPQDRADFRIGGDVVLEVKMNSAQPRSVIRQLTRYARHPDVAAVILASNRAIALPRDIEGKPLFNISLGKAWL